jgi:hypothetical protein
MKMNKMYHSLLFTVSFTVVYYGAVLVISFIFNMPGIFFLKE